MKIFKILIYYTLAFVILSLFALINGSPISDFLDWPALIFVLSGYIFSLNHFSVSEVFSQPTHDSEYKGKQFILNTIANYGIYTGALGTFLGLIVALGNLDEISALGTALALALLPLFYGVLGKIFIFTPLVNHLKQKSLHYQVQL